VDILVNNAGIARAGAALNQTADDWDVVLDTNLKGTFFLSQAVAKTMKERGQGGAIVNIASIAGIRQNAGVAPYAISKAGVVQMTKVLALEFARFGVRVNAIAPGSFPTEITGDYWQSEAGQATIGRIPQRRLGAYGDLDGPLLLLASDLSSYMTGAVLVVDGGHAVASL
jgi:NAD(P)-dependent dehydrogenase (short-subunit alcohol dehydrogenase family)